MSGITLTDGLVKRIKALQTLENNPALKLRVMVNSGGCQGFEYKFSLDTDVKPDDELFEKDGAGVIIDDISLPYMRGAVIDYTDDLIGAYFKIDNPNAASSCGCGTSFST
ncbi:MAG: iron-sulfur cluster insertion protein ErpA [Micavibrio aeruginosavorus]|uniref:Iron-sulfur cluster insertion protein ErpA n=1 Tax=Micavibrio aeruginosavorus TaxID=349221 RepID=A0A2W5N4Q8_9BACT|nr:MAG: iron-sulfur cluster insertion protein ErpA [Micavibrio aeruginosavorus]